MAINTDVTGIQFRLLNESKGPAVQSPRAQCDKKAYQFRLKHTLELQPNLQIFQATVTGLVFERRKSCRLPDQPRYRVSGPDRRRHHRHFLRGLMHIGQNKNEGGRLGDFSAKNLSASFMEAGIELQKAQDRHAAAAAGTQPRFHQDGGAKGGLGPNALCVSRYARPSGFVPRGTYRANAVWVGCPVVNKFRAG
jgi:tRNA uridine 5-carboxymethylaminomethyl modification enzyme